jgi:hypothetical protein
VGAADPNYTFSAVAGSVAVTKAELTVTASDASFTYGAAVPSITASYSGFVNGDTAVATPAVCGTVATSASPVGSYASSCSGADDPNYTFDYVDGSVDVTPKAAVITASDATFLVGDDVPEITPSYSGLVNGDVAPATAPVCSTTATSSSTPGDYPSSCSGADDPNYTFTYVDGTVTVTKPTLTITASSADVELGGAIPAITPSYSGLVGGDIAPDVEPTCTTAATSAAIGRFATTCSGADDADYDIVYVAGTVEISPSDGYAEYDPTAAATTVAAASNGASVGTGTINVVNGGIPAGFAAYQNLTIETVANGAQAVFCKNVAPTTFSTCTPNGATGTMATGGFIGSAPMNRFDVYTVGGGKAVLTPASLTIVNDVPAAGRGMTSRVTATADNGIITYVQSAAPTGTLDLTYGICRTGTATYSASNANCATGVIHYNPGVTSNIGADVTVLGVTNHTYQRIDSAVTTPSTVNPGQSFKVRVAPSPGAIPRLQPSSAGDATVNNSSRFVSVYPIPAGFTVSNFRLIGGDAFSAAATNPAFATLCTTFNTGNCVAKAASGNFIHNSQPYIVVQMPNIGSVNVAGGRQMTMPTLEMTLQADAGGSGTVGNFRLTEIINQTSATLIIGTNATFDGYPTVAPPFNTGITPPVAPPITLASTTIN